MKQPEAEEIFRRRFVYACNLAFANMTPEAQERVLKAATLSEFLLELAQWIPIGTQELDEKPR
jgi:hypothetical protein